MKGWNETQVRGKMDEAAKSVELAQLLLVHLISLQIWLKRPSQAFIQGRRAS